MPKASWDIDEALRLKSEEGYSLTDLAELYGISRQAISERLIRSGKAFVKNKPGPRAKSA